MMKYSDLNYIDTLQQFEEWLDEAEEQQGENFDFELALSNVYYRAGNLDPLRRSLIRSFVAELSGEKSSGIRSFIHNESLRNTMGLKARGWLTYEEYCEEKRKERE